MKTIAIGDIHGHYRQLIELLDKLEHNYNIDFEKDTLVFLGDYVDGGPDTKQVIDHLIYLKEEYPHFKFLYGNHEDLLWDAYLPHHPVYQSYNLWWTQGGKETLQSYAKEFTGGEYLKALFSIKQMPSEHLDFIKQLDPYFETEDYFFVHGGIYPDMTIEENKKETSRHDMIWLREPFISSDYDWGKKIIFGHTVDYDGTYHPKGKPCMPIIRDNKIGIDTFLHNQGRLTALILPEEKIVQTPWTDDATLD